MTTNPKHRRTATISVPDYLARYARLKFDVDPATGGIVIPDSMNLYHCVWQLMARWPRVRTWTGALRRADAPAGNLTIHLPNRRSEGDVRKNPLYWNYLSPRAGRAVGRELKRLFDWEFHHYVDELTGRDRCVTKVAAVRRFCHRYRLGIDAEDALLKNLQRHELRERVFCKIIKKVR